MAVFGVPTSRTRTTRSGRCRAALGMRSRLTGRRRAATAVQLVLRVGVNTGVVATGTTPGRDFLVTGDAVNVAARLQQAAEPGEVLVGDRTFRARRSRWCARCSRASLAVQRPHRARVTAYAVERIAPSGAYRRRRRSSGPFVGREVELVADPSLCDRAVEHSPRRTCSRWSASPGSARAGSSRRP